jgi:hypothetical protein
VWDLIYSTGSRPSGGFRFSTHPDKMIANHLIEKDTRVDKRIASTNPAYFGGCAALIHPTKKLRALIAVKIFKFESV